MNHWEPSTCERSKNSILFCSKGYPFRCFAWIHHDVGPLAGMTFDHQLHNLSEQMMTFVAFMSKNDSLYGKFNSWLNLFVVIGKMVHYAAQDSLDGEILHMIHYSYVGFDMNELTRNNEFWLMYFGPHRMCYCMPCNH